MRVRYVVIDGHTHQAMVMSVLSLPESQHLLAGLDVDLVTIGSSGMGGYGSYRGGRPWGRDEVANGRGSWSPSGQRGGDYKAWSSAGPCQPYGMPGDMDSAPYTSQAGPYSRSPPRSPGPIPGTARDMDPLAYSSRPVDGYKRYEEDGPYGGGGYPIDPYDRHRYPNYAYAMSRMPMEGMDRSSSSGDRSRYLPWEPHPSLPSRV